MQTSLMFIDMFSQGTNSDIQKIAIKMPDGQNPSETGEHSGFTDIMGALMSMSPEQLQKSLEHVEWVRVEGEMSEYAPLIDLSIACEENTEMVKALLEHVAQDSQESRHMLSASPNSGLGPIGLNSEHILPVTENHEIIIAEVANPLADTSTQSNVSSQLADIMDEEVQIDMPKGEVGADKRENSADRAILKQAAVASDELSDEADNAVFKNQEIKKEIRGVKAAPVNIDENDDVSAQKSRPNFETAPLKSEKESPIETPRQRTVPAAEIAAATAGKSELNEQKHPEMRRESKERMKPDILNVHSKGTRLETFSETATEADELQTKSQGNPRESVLNPLKRSASGTEKGVETAAALKNEAAPANETRDNVLRQIVQRMTLRTSGSRSTMNIQLKPEFLGNVHMQISTENQQVVVRMAAESIAVKEMIEQGLQHLKSELQHHGLEIDKFDVSVANDNEEKHPGQDMAGFRQSLKRNKHKASRNGMAKSQKDDDHASRSTEAVHHRSDGAGEISYFA